MGLAERVNKTIVERDRRLKLNIVLVKNIWADMFRD